MKTITKTILAGAAALALVTAGTTSAQAHPWFVPRVPRVVVGAAVVPAPVVVAPPVVVAAPAPVVYGAYGWGWGPHYYGGYYHGWAGYHGYHGWGGYHGGYGYHGYHR